MRIPRTWAEYEEWYGETKAELLYDEREEEIEPAGDAIPPTPHERTAEAFGRTR